MDPYKVLGISQSKIKHESDLLPVRKRAKMLYKRLLGEKKKFDAKKVLEAYDMVKQNQKGKLGEGAQKILGRSRMERMMDKHFNHQTKEIKKDRKVKKELKKARKGEERFHLPGDKESIPTHQRMKRRRRRDRRRRGGRKKLTKKQVETLEGLTRLRAVLSSAMKFPKAIKLVHRWMKEYMNPDNREFVFEVLQDIVELEHLVDEPEARQDVIMTFEYVLSYYSEWFDSAEKPRALREYWRAATVLSAQCHTDDAFTLSRTILNLEQALKLLESHKDDLGDSVSYLVDHPEQPVEIEDRPKRLKTEASLKKEDDLKDEDLKQQMKDELKREFAKEEPDDDSESVVEWPEATDSEAEADVKTEIKTEVKVAVDTKDEDQDDKPSTVDVKEEVPAAPVGPMPSPNPLPSPSSGGTVELLDSDDDAVKAPVEIDSAEESIPEEEISSGDCLSDAESLSSGVIEENEEDDGASSDLEMMVNAEMLDDQVFPMPGVTKSMYRLRDHFTNRCLARLFASRGPMWARSKIDNFFQDLFYRRQVFALDQRTQIEAWQSRIKTMQRFGERNVGEANNPLEAHVPIIDSREDVHVFEADGGAWAGKQTFDSRESASGKVIR